MQRIYDIFYDFKEYFLLVLYCLISLALFSVQDTPPIRTLRSAAVEIYSTLENGLTFFNRYFALMEENERLREQNIQLSAQTNLLRNAAESYSRFQRLLDFKESSSARLVLGRIVDRTFGNERNLITVNRGSSDGIQIDMPVYTDRGLVGRVILVSPHYSLVQPIINPDFKVGVYAEKTHAMGVLNWKGGDEVFAQLEHVPISSDIKLGDYLYTTEFSTFASPNIFVGEITKVHAGEFFYDIEVKLAVDFSALSYVFIELNRENGEKTELQQQYDKFQ
ncbi:rod shape-determining protein MreC [Chloroherpeton thalassium ATCC 35110]|uniref:Cell shape-determining protein MreC n=1 Tax=Chloroherpeton thalassium (strain ATCC 35110 / GB-78) TaxID=517418 RepID=B3QX61_CHLT3|nr:rod shape-determining protein MreC [Chloroherpeton thalassium]ACF14871.1 rod shape-determining protein MreC [Chloroherpeton thalassium ATCC 35110]